jgi:adenosylmethionine-8-amino-7-oxononanoate aminotransferase
MNPTLTERDRKVIWHPYTPQKYASEIIGIAKGDGPYIIDVNGKRYLDAISSWWVNLHGHGHPYIAKRIYEQALALEQVIFAGFTHEPAVQLAEKLLNLLQGPYEKIFYSDNGSTSTEVAIKMAIQYWWNKGDRSRTRILALKNGYHGDTFGAMSVSDRSVFTLAFQDRLFEVQFIDPPSERNINSILADIDPDQTACFIYEPLLQGAGGMNIYEASALNRLLAYCKNNQIVCIADEVMTGFGRTGKLFASQYCSVQPDIVCLSKGITGGTMPLGVTVCTDEIHAAFVDEDALKTFFHGHSFTANPLACTAALASIELLEQRSCIESRENIALSHARFLEKLQQGFAEKIINPRQLGTVVAFEIRQDKNEYLNSIGRMTTAKALEKGVFLRPLGNTVYIMPPYCITEEQLNEVYKAIFRIAHEL